ncbi:MAG: ribosome-associated translation inhibitor RaiA [Candidatus Hydrogenedentota bacterium]
MNVKITGRHTELTDSIKDHVEKKLEKCQAHFDKPMDVDVVLTVEKHRHIADVTLSANGVRLHAEESSNDMYTSVDAAIDKLDRQIRKIKERRNKGFRPKKLAEAELEAQPEPGMLSAETFAEESPAEDDRLPHPERPIVRETLDRKPMDEEEAAMQLELSAEGFIMFTNARTQHINVMYVRDDGSFGLIQPQF